MNSKNDKWKLVFKRALSPNFLTVTKSFYDQLRNGLIYFNGKVVFVHVDKDELNEKAKIKIEEIIKDFSKIEEEKNRVIQLYDDAVDWARNVRKRGFDNLSDEEIISVLEKLREWYRKIGRSIWAFHFIIENELTEYLKKRGYSSLLAMGILVDITQPEISSHSLKADKRMYELASEIAKKRDLWDRINERLDNFVGAYWTMEGEIQDTIKIFLKKDNEIRNKIKEYIFMYGGVYDEYGTPRFLDEHLIDNFEKSDFWDHGIYDKLSSIIFSENIPMKLKLKEANMERIKRLRRWYFENLLKLSKNDVAYKYAEVLSWASSIRLKRRETLTLIDYYIAPLLKKVVMKFDESLKNDVRYLELDDIIDMAEGVQQNYRDRIKKNKEGWIWVKRDNQVKYIKTGRSALDAYREEIHLPQEVEGVVRIAPSGRDVIDSKAKIVTSPEHLEKIEEEDIMVTLMVHPNYLSPIYAEYIKKLKAIIAEEGTLTCHLLNLYTELSHRFNPNILLVTDARGATDLIGDDDYIKIDLKNVSSEGRVKIEVVRK